jgi:hypothetical protein
LISGIPLHNLEKYIEEIENGMEGVGVGDDKCIYIYMYILSDNGVAVVVIIFDC